MFVCEANGLLYPDTTTMADFVLLALATCYISQGWVGVVPSAGYGPPRGGD